MSKRIAVAEEELPNYDKLIDYYFTDEYTKTYSINYQEGDKYINEFRHWMTVIAYAVGQTTGEETKELVFEKNMFRITCPQFVGDEDFYLESLDYYLLFYGFYTTINITELLEKSVDDLKVNNFYNREEKHLYCFSNDDYTDFEFTITDKLSKNIKLIKSMAPLLWDNSYYKLRRDVLEVGGTPFLVNGEELTLDIVNSIDATGGFTIVNLSGIISNKVAMSIYRSIGG